MNATASALRRTVVTLLLAVASLVGLTFAAAAPASADTVTRYVTVCVSGSSSARAHAQATAYWDDGSAWVAQSTVSVASGCNTLALKHNGYYYIQAYGYVRLPCALYRYYGTTNVFIKQRLATSSSVTLPLSYYDTIPLYC
jgi:hypothetical protein